MATDATIGGTNASASTDPTDAALVESAQGGNRSAFAELVERHRQMLVALCRRALGGSQAIDDVVQGTALAALLGIGTLRDPERFGPWLSGIGLNICRRWQRERWDRCWSWEAVAGGVAPDRLVDPRLDPAEMAAERELIRKMRGAVEQLPPGQRDAVVLFYFSGLTQGEMAVLLGTEVGAVKARLHKARKSLRQRLWSAWKEEEMETIQQAGMVRMRPGDVLRLPADGDRPPEFVIMLEEVDGRRRLPIWVGQSEASWIVAGKSKSAIFFGDFLEQFGIVGLAYRTDAPVRPDDPRTDEVVRQSRTVLGAAGSGRRAFRRCHLPGTASAQNASPGEMRGGVLPDRGRRTDGAGHPHLHERRRSPGTGNFRLVALS